MLLAHPGLDEVFLQQQRVIIAHELSHQVYFSPESIRFSNYSSEKIESTYALNALLRRPASGVKFNFVFLTTKFFLPSMASTT
ncbi:hypothetical protein Y032_0481g2256 [Ancylostoma ceylanicum]|uniref:Uncharacterized protein n=1 Tax=Ancylostoma ceylanicum TaxID=53326 RepID=A0A016WWX2_9BILA|nr:hypothetical protein Y032_0481g2256 [Ancylostoma ceylanicum]